MPQEQEMPAPVTTTMRLLLATESERLASVRRVAGSENDAARSNVVTMRRRVVEREGKGQGVDGIKVSVNRPSRWAPQIKFC